MKPICPTRTKCKCCPAEARLYGVVDFNKHCEVHRSDILDFAGIPVYYYQCPACRFLFTTAFDQFSVKDFRKHIYNDNYPRIDPDARDARPRHNADNLRNMFAHQGPTRILDYGGGEGLLAELLNVPGIRHVDTYDPIVNRHAARPTERYECIVCFEAIEHSTNPKFIFADMIDLLADPGFIFFSTLLQPPDIDRIGLHWLYAAPRNGHVSLHTAASIRAVVEPLGFTLGSVDNSTHVLYRRLPAYALGLQHYV